MIIAPISLQEIPQEVVHAKCSFSSLPRNLISKGLVEVLSARKAEFQTLMRTGRSRQLFTHLLYDSLIIVSEVGLMASRSPSSLFPEWVTQKTSGVKPSKCSASLLSNLSGMSRGK